MSDPTERLPASDEDAGGGRPRRRFADRDLPIAIASGVLLAAMLIGSVLWHPIAFSLVVTGLVLVGLVETSRVLEQHGWPVALPVVVVAGLIMLAGAYRAGPQGIVLGLVTLFFGAIVWDLADPERHTVVKRLTTTLLLGIWLPFLGSFGVLLITRREQAWVAVLATAGSAIFSDIGAYVAGNQFGRTKLAPSVSPGKTWEGVIGGLAIVAVLAAFVLPALGPLFTWPVAVAFAVVVGAASVVGDLAESMVKRDLQVKDFGGIIPGHGGVLDRVDAILFALPVGYFALELLGR